MKKHTPTPWRNNGRKRLGDYTIAAGDTAVACANVANAGTFADAEYIVRAVNCHADLLAALDLLVTHADPDTHDGEYSHVEMADLYHAISDARASIARARGEA